MKLSLVSGEDSFVAFRVQLVATCGGFVAGLLVGVLIYSLSKV